MTSVLLHVVILLLALQELIAFENITISQSWHLLNMSQPIINTSHYYYSLFAQSIRDGWNLPSSNVFKQSYQELGFDKAMDIIFRHQHPQDCSNASFLVSLGYASGYGSEIHVEG